MCEKMGNNEIDSMKNMMAMAIYFVLADSFDIDAIDITPESHLEKDLHMTTTIKQDLSVNVKDMFNGYQLDFDSIHDVQDVIDQITTVH